MTDLTIKTTTECAGQPRPYAPHTYRSTITVEGGQMLDEQVKALAQVLVHPFTEDARDGTMSDHFRARLTEFAPRPGGEWLVEVQIPFCD